MHGEWTGYTLALLARQREVQERVRERAGRSGEISRKRAEEKEWVGLDLQDRDPEVFAST